jgi:hypothetical protein
MSGDFVPGRPDRDEPEPTIDARVPDAIEPITAYRVWRTDSYGRLRSFNHHGAWVPSRWTVARCARDGGAAPLEGCTCGLYAAKELEDVLALAETLGETTAVVGRVELAGKVIEHDHGYRAELARVRDILPIEGQRARIEHIARRFGVPIGEEIPASSIRAVRPRRPASSECFDRAFDPHGAEAAFIRDAEGRRVPPMAHPGHRPHHPQQPCRWDRPVPLVGLAPPSGPRRHDHRDRGMDLRTPVDGASILETTSQFRLGTREQAAVAAPRHPARASKVEHDQGRKGLSLELESASSSSPFHAGPPYISDEPSHSCLTLGGCHGDW